MLDRRAQPRSRTFLGGTLAFNRRSSVMTCIVRNLTADGAKVSFEQGATVPDEIDLVVPHRAESWRGHIIWRAPNAAGIAFRNRKPSAQVIPLDATIRLNRLNDENRRLRERLDQARGEAD
ncbi:MAG: PilZ domain-containing protein [Xanthobacteraceae bacterium]|nr:MAG: PilZ domain-containing protein [Xanthobacteraceae bacterium]